MSPIAHIEKESWLRLPMVRKNFAVVLVEWELNRYRILMVLHTPVRK